MAGRYTPIGKKQFTKEAQDLEKFTKEYGRGPFPTEELAAEYSRLRCADWRNLRPMGVVQLEDGNWEPRFNVWD